MSNKFFLSFLLLVTASFVFGQETDRCGTNAHTEHLIEKDPTYAVKLMKAEEAIQQWLADNPTGAKMSGGMLTIPCVVHVVYRTPSQNISDAQIMSQIDILNEDFQRLNPDAINTPEGFLPVAGSMDIEFCLAQRDPDDNPTTGIVRVETDVTSFSTDDDVKFAASGGSNQWDPDRYFNIWVCNLTGGLLGYGEFPTGGFSDTYGVVIDYQYFGDIGTATFPFDKGRTATHEVGHCFNLRHIWGDDGSSCGGSDLVADTPNQGGPTYGCPSFPDYDACSPAGDGIMFMNYMDYSDDACFNMFTAGQVDRMWSAIDLYYPELLESNGCEPIDLLDNDARLVSVTEPNGLYCEDGMIPELTIQNYGDFELNTVDIEYSIDGGAVTTFTWTGSLTTLEMETFTLPEISVGEGVHTFAVNTANPNGVEDLNPDNDSGETGFSLFTVGTGVPVGEGFEEETFPPDGWSVKNNSGGITWERTDVTGAESDACVWMNNYEYDDDGATDDMYAIPVNLSGIESPMLLFDVAYAYFKQGATEYTDALEILVSTDCVVSSTSVYFKEGDELSTRTPTAVPFTPTSSQWRRDSVSLSAFAGNDFITVIFRSITGYGNNLYIDNVNIFEEGTTLSLDQNISGYLFEVFPIPADDLLQVRVDKPVVSGDIQLTDLHGKIVWRNAMNGLSAFTIDVSELYAGIYLLRMTDDRGNTDIRKVIIQ